MKGLKSKLNRRDFLSLSATTAAVTLANPNLAFALKSVSISPSGELSILQGSTSDSTTQFSIDIDKSIPIKIQALDENGNLHLPVKVTSASREYSKTRVDKAIFIGLRLNMNYQLQILNEQNDILDHRGFRTLDSNLVNPKIAFLSCMRHTLSSLDAMWEGIPQHNPDLIIFLGDNVYGNNGTEHSPELLWKRYIETRKRIPFYHYYNLTPVMATWDDHDVGNDGAEADYQYIEDSILVFEAFYAQDAGYSNELVAGPGNAKIFSAFHQHFVMFDGRSFRSTPNKTMFGEIQLEWFFKNRPQTTDPIWLAMGSQFFGAYTKKESYEGIAPAEFKRFLAELKTWPNPVSFVAGDKHYSEIMDIESAHLGYKTFELTSSSMHSFTRPLSKKNPRRRSIHKFKNFMLLTIQNTTNGFTANLKVIGSSGKIKHSDTVSVIKDR